MQILNRKSAPQVVRLFDCCFKKGVNDAYEFSDDMGVKEFIDTHKNAWTFGILGEPDDYDWQLFRVHMYQLARANHLGKFAENYIFRIRRKDPIWCLLPYCMRFYIMGMEEWLAYPNQLKLSLFNSNSRIHWDPNLPVKSFTTLDFISYMHNIAHEFRRLPQEERPISADTMDGYCAAIYSLTRKYATKNSHGEEDF